MSLSPSPSLTSSVESAKSSTLPSPGLRGSDIAVSPPPSKSKLTNPSHLGCRFDPRIRVIGRRMSFPESLGRFCSASPPTSPLNSPQRERVILPQTSPPSSPRDLNLRHRSLSSVPRYRPYFPKGNGTVPSGLHYAARSLGVITHSDITLEEVKEKRGAFTEALSAMPDSILLSALDVKQADHERVSLRLALADAEIRYSERFTLFLSNVRDQHVGALAVSGAYLNILNQVIGGRSLEDAENDKRAYTGTCEEQRAALAVLESHVSQVRDVIGPRVSRWFERRGAEKDPDDPHDILGDSEEAWSEEGTDLEDNLKSLT